MKKMAKVVDDQNSKDKNYVAISNNFDNSIALKLLVNLFLKANYNLLEYRAHIIKKD